MPERVGTTITCSKTPSTGMMSVEETRERNSTMPTPADLTSVGKDSVVYVYSCMGVARINVVLRGCYGLGWGLG